MENEFTWKMFDRCNFGFLRNAFTRNQLNQNILRILDE